MRAPRLMSAREWLGYVRETRSRVRLPRALQTSQGALGERLERMVAYCLIFDSPLDARDLALEALEHGWCWDDWLLAVETLCLNDCWLGTLYDPVPNEFVLARLLQAVQEKEERSWRSA